MDNKKKGDKNCEKRGTEKIEKVACIVKEVSRREMWSL